MPETRRKQETRRHSGMYQLGLCANAGVFVAVARAVFLILFFYAAACTLAPALFCLAWLLVVSCHVSGKTNILRLRLWLQLQPQLQLTTTMGDGGGDDNYSTAPSGPSATPSDMGNIDLISATSPATSTNIPVFNNGDSSYPYSRLTCMAYMCHNDHYQ